jgi:hypothetical protein
MVSNITLQEKETSPTVLVTIGQTKVEEILSRKVTVLTPTKTSQEWDISIGSKDTKIYDVLMVEHRYAVTGVITTDLGTSDTNTAVLDKKNDLKKLYKAGGVSWMTFEGSTFSGMIEKLTIREQAEDTTAGTASPTFDIMFTFLKGVNLGA